MADETMTHTLNEFESRLREKLDQARSLLRRAVSPTERTYFTGVVAGLEAAQEILVAAKRDALSMKQAVDRRFAEIAEAHLPSGEKVL